jgi:short-subunit dehydrogenase
MTNPSSASPGRTALVTGASSGIGLELARVFASRGWNVVVTSRSAQRLGEIATQLESEHGIRAVPLAFDLTLPDGAGDLAKELSRQSLEIDALVNNAGFATYGPFASASLDDELAVIELNVVALTELTKRLLPGMLRRGRGYILNVASTAAFQPGPLMAVYYATKAYVLSFSEALAEELAKTPVRVTALCPGPTETGLQRRAAMEDSKLVAGKALMPAADVAQFGYDALMAGRRVAIPGLRNRLLALSPRFAPRRFVTAIVRRMQEPTSSE